MTASNPVQFVNRQGVRVGNEVVLSGGDNEVHLVDAAGVDIGPANPLPTEMLRGTLDTEFTFTNATVSNVINKRHYAGVEIGPVPLALNGRTLTILSGPAATATSPNYRDSDGTRKALQTIALVTGAREIFQAEVYAIHDISVSVSGGNVTTTLPVQLTA